MLKNKTQISGVISKAVIAVSMVIRVILQMQLPVWARGSFTVDDYLMARYADSIVETGWLGKYDYFAMNKLPGYSFFLALNDKLGLPYMLSVGLFYCLACYIFLAAIRKIAKNETVSLICYLLLLFSPAMFDDHIAQKIYRMALIPPLVIIIVSSYLVLYTERKRGIKKNLGWIIGASLAYAAFYIIREDSSWFMCFILGASAVLLGLYIIENRKKVKLFGYVKYIAMLASPIIAGTIAVNAISLKNYNEYGVYAKNDFNETHFSSVCGMLMRIEPEEEIPKIYISKSTLDRAMEASPTLRQMQEAMEKRYADPTSPGLMNGEFYKAMFVWNFRWAAGESGLYTDAVETDKFFEQVYNELSAAFDNGTFEKRNALVLSPWARPIREGDIDGIVKYSFQGYRDIISYDDIDAVVYAASGPAEHIEVMADVTNQTLIEPNNAYYLKGWMFSIDPEKEIEITLYDANGNEFIPAFKGSEDVYQHFLGTGEDYANAQHCRFEMSLTEKSMNINEIYARINLGGEEIFNDLLSNIKTLDNDDIRMSIDTNGYSSAVSAEMVQDAQESVDALNKFIGIYSKTWAVAAIIGALAFVSELCVNIRSLIKKKNTNFSAWIIKLGMLLTIWGNLLVISVNYFETDADDYREYYAAGVYPIWHIFICLSICTLFMYAKNLYDIRTNKQVAEAPAAEAISVEQSDAENPSDKPSDEEPNNDESIVKEEAEQEEQLSTEQTEENNA